MNRRLTAAMPNLGGQGKNTARLRTSSIFPVDPESVAALSPSKRPMPSLAYFGPTRFSAFQSDGTKTPEEIAAEKKIADDAAAAAEAKRIADAAKTSTVTFSPEQEAEIQRRMNDIAGKVRTEEKERQQREADKAKADAERVSKEKQGEFEALYTVEKQKVAELEGFKTNYDALAERTNKSIDAQIKDWPKSVTALDPGKDNVLARLKWLDSSSELAAELIAARKAAETDGGRGGSGGGGGKTKVEYKPRYARPAAPQS